MEDKRARREQIARRYAFRLRERVTEQSLPSPSALGVPWVIDHRGRSSHHLFTIHVRPDHRDATLSKLGDAGIGTAVNYRAIHRLAHLASRLALPQGALPVAEELGNRTISLPLYPTLTDAEQDRVVEAVAMALSPQI